LAVFFFYSLKIFLSIMISTKKWTVLVAFLSIGWVACNKGDNKPTTLPGVELKSLQIPEEQRAVPELTEIEKARMVYALQCSTISGLKNWPTAEFKKLARLIDFETYKNKDNFLLRYPNFSKVAKKIPFLDPTLKIQVDSTLKYTLVYIWEGSNKSLKPFIFMAHQDVVPVANEDLPFWTHLPFLGKIAPDFQEPKDSAFYGRGAIDNKGNMMSMLEAAERLATQNFQPQRSLIFIFEHDEEGKGTGAKTVANYFRSIHKASLTFAEMLMDEGGSVVDNLVPGLARSALIGTYEKGFATIEIDAEKQGGHASMPDNTSAITITAEALRNVYTKPLTYEFDPSTMLFFKYMAPEIKDPKVQRWFAAPDSNKNELVRLLSRDPKTHAMIHTTVAPTIFSAGDKANVIPSVAKATMNLRIIPPYTPEMVLDSVRARIPNVARKEPKEKIPENFVKVTMLSGAIEPTGSSHPDGVGYFKVSQMVKRTFGDIPTSPFLMVGATDSRFFGGLADHYIKFSPVFNPQGFHTYNERITLDSYRHSIWFYQQLMSEGNCKDCNTRKPATLPAKAN
jgi:carboxypeptidase PM20D1